MRTPKVVITAPWGERLGGAENMLWMFLKHVDRDRVSPLVVFFQPGPFEAEVSGLGIPTVVVPTGRLRQVGKLAHATWTLSRLLHRHQPDLLLNWSPKTQLYGSAAALLAGRADRVVWWQHGVSKGHWMDRLASMLPARAVGCSSHSAARVQATFVPRRRTFVVNPGIDPPQRLTDDELRAIRSRLGIPPDKAIVGTVGRLQPDRGQHRFLSALAVLRGRGHDVYGLVVGGNAFNLSPGYETYLMSLVVKLGLTGAVTFTGQVPDAGPYIQLMQVQVNASLGESFGMALLEAMALGVPVVAFDEVGPAEIVETNRSGLLVPPGNQLRLTNAVEQLLNDPDLRRRLASGAAERFCSYFTAERMTQGLHEQLERAVA
jgi:glycosyltransferase involved in cell wall biosynthesis